MLQHPPPPLFTALYIEDAYHLYAFAGCGGPLRDYKRPVVEGHAVVHWVVCNVVGCTPQTCTGSCDRSLSGIRLGGLRFAGCQFGQRTAGCPLDVVLTSLQRYFARLPEPIVIARVWPGAA
jgi:hypothetical protein